MSSEEFKRELSPYSINAIDEALIIADTPETEEEITEEEKELQIHNESITEFLTNEDPTNSGTNFISNCANCGDLLPYPVILIQLDTRGKMEPITEATLPQVLGSCCAI